MIKITREQLLLAEKSLVILVNAKMPIAISYKIGKIIKQVQLELQETEKMRQEIVQKYSLKDDKGEIIVDKKNNTMKIIPENQEEFSKEMGLLFNEVCELIGEPIDINVLDNLSMTVQEVNLLEPFLKLE